MHTGSIIDFYDDPNGFVLKTKMAAEQVPEFIKTAHYLEDDKRESLPDDVFALVMVDRGEKLKKYACVDKGNTALSVIYFLENGDRLPEEAQKTAAANLLTACSWHDLQPPAPLMKLAGKRWDSLKAGWRQAGKDLEKFRGKIPTKGGLKVDLKPTMSSFKEALKSKNPYVMGSIARLAAPGAAKAGVAGAGVAGAYALGKRRGKKKTAGLGGLGKAFGTATNVANMHGAISAGAGRHKQMTAPKMPQPGMPKIGDLTGSNIMPLQSDGEKEAAAKDLKTQLSAGIDGRRVTADELKAHIEKGLLKKSASMSPYVDVTGKSAPPRFEKVAHQRFALVKEGQNRFPIDSYGDVLEADRWFNDHGESLHPEDRREMCTKLAARADEIGCKVSDYIRKYAGKGYAPDGEVRVAVSTRMQYFQDDSPERDMLDGLMDKYAHVPPDVFCEAVKQFDEATGLDYHWDDGVYDPWYTTYGFVKEAAWEFSTHGDKINEEQLKQVVNASYPLIREKFGEEMANSLKKSPVQIFSSLPLDTKRIIMRMANDPQPSPALVLA